ncbi:MAG: Rne/Rng family ribonuclease [Clostridia bacterium]|nr:Rne/Rng family ribonuclease [Clostridia bacterium]
MKKEWFFDRYCGQQFAALVEDGRLVEFSAESEPRKEIVGNIYKGRVTNVLAGMNAAFISCGFSKNCYLSMEETYTDYTKYDGTPVATGAKAWDLKVGDEIIVQVTKPARGNKGAKVTTHLSFVGKCVIYLPCTDFLGISRKITDVKQREKLLKIAEKMRETPSEGFIIRTQAPLSTQRQLKTEAGYLRKLYREMLETAQNAPVGTVLYEDDELPVRMMRDSYGDEIEAIHVGDEELYQRLRRLIRLRGDISNRKLIKYTGDRVMMDEQGIMQLVYDTTQPVVPLAGGGSIVIDPTEAMTVVDVNTGKYIGDKSREETVFAVNLEAAREIARQVRLRNIGGIVVVDFIDMASEEHRKAVTDELRSHLEKDKAKCNVLPMSELCLTQFTRKRLGSDIPSMLSKPCPLCHGIGHVHEDIFVITRIRAAILDCFAEGHTAAIIDLNVDIMQKILREGLFRIEAGARWKDKRVYFIPHKTYKEETFSVRGEKGEILRLPDNAQILY